MYSRVFPLTSMLARPFVRPAGLPQPALGMTAVGSPPPVPALPPTDPPLRSCRRDLLHQLLPRYLPYRSFRPRRWLPQRPSCRRCPSFRHCPRRPTCLRCRCLRRHPTYRPRLRALRRPFRSAKSANRYRTGRGRTCRGQRTPSQKDDVEEAWGASFRGAKALRQTTPSGRRRPTLRAGSLLLHLLPLSSGGASSLPFAAPFKWRRLQPAICCPFQVAAPPVPTRWVFPVAACTSCLFRKAARVFKLLSRRDIVNLLRACR